MLLGAIYYLSENANRALKSYSRALTLLRRILSEAYGASSYRKAELRCALSFNAPNAKLSYLERACSSDGV